MTQKEFDAADQETMEVVNRAQKAAPEDGVRRSSAARDDKTVGYGCSAGPNTKAKRKRQMLWTILQVLLCWVVAFAFLVMLVRPEWLEYLANLGIMCAVVAGAVRLDRVLRGR